MGFLRAFNVFRSSSRNREMRPVRQLELHVTHACNLACESCSHYSNQGHIGNLDLAQAERWMAHWSNRLAVETFVLLGGEPTVHPQLSEFVSLARRHWPLANIRLNTNGFFLSRHPDLPLKLAAAGNSHLVLSIHHDDEAYRDRLRPALELLERWQREHGIVVQQWPSHQTWTRRYIGAGSTMLPFEDARPRQSWEICPAKYCKQLYEGKLWKCAPLAYLGLQNEKYGLSDKWDPYLRYQPLDPLCTDEELDRFLAIEDEPACAMCSAERRHFTLPNPMKNLPASAAK
jgi:hypothetical protein